MKVSFSNLIPETGYPENFRGFLSPYKKNAGRVLK
jgi:hypothetical protein